MDAALGRDRQVYRHLGQEEKSENKLGSPEPGPQGQNPLDSARHMSHLPVGYPLNDNEDTQLSGCLRRQLFLAERSVLMLGPEKDLSEWSLFGVTEQLQAYGHLPPTGLQPMTFG